MKKTTSIALSRRGFVGAAAVAGFPAIASAGSLAFGSEVSPSLVRAAAGMAVAPRATNLAAMGLLHLHLSEDVGFYRLLAEQGVRPEQMVPDLGNIEAALMRLGLTPDRALLSDLIVAISGSQLQSLAGLSELARVRLEQHPVTRLRGGMHPLGEASDASVVAGGAALMVGGAAAINVGVGIGTAAGATFASSVVATVLVTGGAALFVVGAGLVGVVLFRALNR